MASYHWIFITLLLNSFCLSVLTLLVVNLEQTNYTVSESLSGNGNGPGFAFCLLASGDLVSPVDFHFTVTGGTATNGVDYTLTANQTIEPDDCLDNGVFFTCCVPVFQVCDDNVPEDDENVTITVSSTSLFVYWIDSTFTIVITDDDRISVAFTRDTYTVNEGEQVEVCAEASGPSERGYVPLTMVPSEGTAANEDFRVAGVTVTSVNGQSRKCMMMAATDDDIPEEKEFFRLNVSSSDSMVDVDERSSVRIYINDNDSVGFSLAQSVYRLDEGETTTVCLTTNNHDLPPIRYHLIVLYQSGNATGQDFTIHNLQDYNVGSSSHHTLSSICFDVLTNDDSLSEGVEMATFQLHLSTDVEWVTLDLPQEIVIDIIINDNDFVKVDFDQSSYIVLEGPFPYMSFCVTVDGVVSRTLPPPTLSITTNSASATGGVDYVVDDILIPLPSSHFCHQLRILDDALPESQENFNICIQSQSSLITFSKDCVEVYIIDNEIPELRLDELQYTVNENEGSIEICTEMIGSLTNNDIQVHLSTADHTAVGLYDYQPKEHVFLFGLSREQRQCINVMVWTDNMLEEGETFRVSLSYDDDDMAPLNISRPYSLIHIEDNSDVNSVPACKEGDIMLNGGSSSSTDGYELVEMCEKDGRWVSVCDTTWSEHDTATVCQQAESSTHATAQKSLPSLVTSAHTFTCTTTEATLVQCMVEGPENKTCHHLVVICVNDSLDTTTVPDTTSSVGTDDNGLGGVSNLGHPTSDSSPFPMVGVIVGILSALMLVGGVMVISVVVGAVVWKRKRSKSVTLEGFHDGDSSPLDNPVYAVLEKRDPISSSPALQDDIISTSYNNDLYSEIPPLSSQSPHSSCNGTIVTSLPSFYDVIRPHVVESEEEIEEGEDEEQRGEEEGEGGINNDRGNDEMKGGNGEGEKSENCRSMEYCCEQLPPSEVAPTEITNMNLYETVLDKLPYGNEKDNYSTLERRQGSYATLEPYTGGGGGGTLRLKQIEKKSGEENGLGDNQEYSHLHH